MVGEIVAVGSQAPRRDLLDQPLGLGDRVSWAVVANCGQCAMCQHDLPQKCLQSVKYGHEAFRPGLELVGGLAEHCLLVAGTQIVRWPSQVPLAVACPASCATSTAMAALEQVPQLAGASLVVLGAGLLGLTTCAIAASRGATRIVCVDPVADRRALAQRFGATSVCEPAELVAHIHSLTEGLGCDAVIEMSGADTAFQAALAAMRIGGMLVLVGSVFPAPPVAVQVEQFVRRCVRIHGVHNYAPRHLGQAVDFLSQNHTRYPFADIVADWWPLAEYRLAFERASQPGVVRVGVTCS
jgi:alcohol dehydrogenase